MSDLMAQVEAQTGLAAAEQSLSFAASSLDATPSSALLSSVGIVDGSTVYLSVASTSAPFVVHVSLPASLSSTFGSTLTFRGGSASDLVSSLKAKVESVTGVPAAIQVLSLGSTTLANDMSPVDSYGVVSGSTVTLTLTSTLPPVVAVVHVALPMSLQPSHGTTLTFGLAAESDTLPDLMAQVEAQTGLAAAQQSLSFAASSLDATPGSALLSSVGIVDGSTVYLSVASTPAPFVVHVSLPASLSSTFGSTLTFRGGSVSDLVSSLEAKVESVTGVPAAIQVLSLGSTTLANDTSPVGSYGVVGGSTVELTLTSLLRPVMAVVHVALQPPHSTTLTVAFNSSMDTVSGLMAQVEAQTGLALAEQSLSFAALSLDATPGSALLSSVGIVDGSTVDLSVASTPAPFVVHVSLPASLNGTYGSTLTFRGGSVSDLVSSLESKVESVTGVPAEIQVLSLGSTALANETSTAGSYGLVSGSTVELTLTSDPPAVVAVVHVALPVSLQPSHGTTLTFGLATSSDTLSGLRAQVEAQTGLAAAKQSLSFAASSLGATPGSTLLSSVGIVDGSTVYLSVLSSSASFVVHVSLPASLSSTFGSTLTFRGGSLSDVISSLKAKVESVTGVPAAIQVLSLGSTVLAAEASTIGSYGIVSGSTVDPYADEHPAVRRCGGASCAAGVAAAVTRHYAQVWLQLFVGHCFWPQGAGRGADWPCGGGAVPQLCWPVDDVDARRYPAQLIWHRRRLNHPPVERVDVRGLRCARFSACLAQHRLRVYTHIPWHFHFRPCFVS